jgi:hypothetical protein
VARRSFRTSEALVVVSTDGYFDVYSHEPRRPNDRPAYRGVFSELGSSVRGADGKMSVRPDSVALDAAVTVWSRAHGAAAARGDMGLGRTTGHDAPPPPAKAARSAEGAKPAAEGAKPAAEGAKPAEKAAAS